MSQITTHILDTAQGCPAMGVTIILYTQQHDNWVVLAEGITNDDGRVANLLADDTVLAAGAYKVRFITQDYFTAQKCFYPHVDVVFNISGDGQHYHIPLLLSPYGYSTYRGS